MHNDHDVALRLTSLTRYIPTEKKKSGCKIGAHLSGHTAHIDCENKRLYAARMLRLHCALPQFAEHNRTEVVHCTNCEKYFPTTIMFHCVVHLQRTKKQDGMIMTLRCAFRRSQDAYHYKKKEK